MKAIEKSKKLELVVVACGNHHCIKDIMQEFKTVQMTPCVDGIEEYGIFYSFMLNVFRGYVPDMAVLLGDRFEVHAAATAALLLQIPIAHIAGGEQTEGAFDDEIRNAISMVSTVHFTAHERYACKLARMFKECSPDHYNCLYKLYDLVNSNDFPFKNNHNIFNVGAPIIDLIMSLKLKNSQELQEQTEICMNLPYILACFQPVTKELGDIEAQMCGFHQALIKSGMQVVLIQPNADPRNQEIRKMNAECASVTENWHLFENLSQIDYFSLMKNAFCMVGNSSSGIIEAASFNIPVVNIGNRQKGRLRTENIFDCGYKEAEILAAMDKASAYRASGAVVKPIYGDGRSAERIVKVLEDINV
jgi:GDP/UDP-N,N'-diacetylbacillosamine 2-epimerase (hydrolysing)